MWSRRESNPRPNSLQKCFLHVYPLFDCRLQEGTGQTGTITYLLNFHLHVEARACYPTIYDVSDQTPAGEASGETSGSIVLDYDPEAIAVLSISLSCISISIVAIYWLRELVFNGTVSQPPTCLQIHTQAVKTKRPHLVLFCGGKNTYFLFL